MTAVIEIYYDAKCKHCIMLKEVYKGKRKKHECKVTGESITLKTKACKDFRLC